MTCPIQPEPYFLAAPKIEKSPRISLSLRNPQMVQEISLELQEPLRSGKVSLDSEAVFQGIKLSLASSIGRVSSHNLV